MLAAHGYAFAAPSVLAQLAAAAAAEVPALAPADAEAAALEVRRDLETFREVFFGKQSRGELPVNETLLAELDRLESARC